MPDKPYVNVHTLALEVTRCCNMDPPCEICIRGPAQDMNLSSVDMRIILQQIDHIDEVLFTGGEPSLNLQAIRKFIELAELYHVAWESFYIVTNGIANQEDLAMLTLKMYQGLDEKEYCGIALSRDAYHNDVNQNDIIKGLAYYKTDKEHEPEDDFDWVLQVGNAAANGIGRPDTYAPTEFEVDATLKKNKHTGQVEVDSVNVDLVYLSCTGYVYPNCNMSYADMDRQKTLYVTDFLKHVKAIAEDK